MLSASSKMITTFGWGRSIRRDVRGPGIADPRSRGLNALVRQLQRELVHATGTT